MSSPYGLLAAVRKYPVGDADPFENFLTEGWAWILRSDDDLCSKFVAWITADLVSEEEPLDVATQFRVKSGFIDLLVETENFVLIFEHKTWSGFGDNQIEKYHTDISKKFAGKQVVCVAITGYVYSCATSQSVKTFSKTWGSIGQWLGQVAEKPEFADDHTKQFVLRTFINLIEHEGLGMKKALDIDALKVFYTFSELEPSIKQLFLNIRTCHPWEKYSKLVPRADKKMEPRSIRQRWGRIGIELGRPEDWTPGLFFGVLVNNYDHFVEPSNKENGPDLCLIVDLDSKVQNFLKKSLMQDIEKYQQFTSDLATLAKNIGWDFHDHISDKLKQKNYWHPLYVRKPLSQVLEGASSFEEQQERITIAMAKIFDAITAMPSYFELKKSLKEKK